MFPDNMPLGQARVRLRKLIADGDGHDCPLCTQRVKVYRRKLNHQNIRVLAAMLRQHDHDWCHLPTVMKGLPDIAHQGGHATIAGYWNLIEEERGRREDGGRAGWWRMTPLGEEWLRGQKSVRKYALTYDAKVLGYEGGAFYAQDAWGTFFDLRDLMDGR